MTTQTAFAVVGGIVGSFFGYPQLGFVIGSLIGSALTPGTKTEGPKLDDLKVTVSTYGAGIAILYGTMRMGGNVIFSTDKIDVATTESQGKGGGNELTTHTYYVHMATALCEGPITAVRKRWFDGALKYDQSSGIPIESALASASSPYSTATVYLGTDPQMPDPTMESIKGVGNVPGYQGIAYVMDTWLETPGGRIPQGTFEVSNTTEPDPEITQLVTVPIVTNDLYSGVCQPTGIWHGYRETTGVGFPTNFTVYYGENGPVQPVRVFVLPEDSTSYHPYPVFSQDQAFWIWPNRLVDGSAKLDLIDAKSGIRSTVYTEPGASTCPGYAAGRAAFDSAENLFVFLSYELGAQPLIVNRFSGVGLAVEAIPDRCFQVGIYGGVVYVLTDVGGQLTMVRRLSSNGQSDAFMPDTLGPVVSMTDIGRIYSCMCINEHGIFALMLTGTPSVTSRTIYKITPAAGGNPGAWTPIYVGGAELAIDNVFTGPGSRTFYTTNEMAVVGPLPSSDDYKAIRFAALDALPYPVADILMDQCTRAPNITVDDVDVSGITDETRGYVIKNPASPMANMQPILMAYGIDLREQDGKIQFIKRADQVSVMTIPYVDLASHDNGEDPGDPMPLTHQQEVECPKTVAVSFLNYDDDYQTATESFTGQVTTSELITTIELPIALTPDEGATIAFRLWCDAWNSRNARSLKLQRQKYLRLSPGDVVTVEYPEGTLNDWRLTKITDTTSLLECEAVPADSAIYSQTAVGATSYSGGQDVAPLPSQTRLTLADSPIFRDQDNNGGIYAAMEGFGSNWRGATLFVGEDDTSLQDRGTVHNPCPTGFAEQALGSYTLNTTDGINSVIVSMGDDVLAGVTNDLMMTSRANLALLGQNGRWEAIQFRGVTDLGGGRYQLYGLLRGLYGTERNRSTHQVGDTFLLLAGVAGILRPSMGASEIGQNKSYRAVSLGRDLDTAASITYANTAEGLRPYAPWDARKSKAASNDQTLTWQRRTRLSTNALRGIVPLGETTEAYRVRFFTSSAFTTVATTKVSTSATVTITSAEQTAAGLTPGGTLWVGISQVSDSYGAGSELQVTL